MRPTTNPPPRCECGRLLRIHVGVGRFGGTLVWASCSGTCGRTFIPYTGPLTPEVEVELARLRKNEAG